MSVVLCGELRVEVVARPGTRAARPAGSSRPSAGSRPSRRHVSGLAGSRSIACSSARRGLVVRPAACSIAARSNSGSTDERVAVVGDPRDRRRRGQRALVEPLERGVLRVDGAHRLQRAPGADDGRARRRARPRPTSTRRGSPRGAARPRPVERARAASRATRPSPRTAAPGSDVAGHEPRPVDRRVQAEDERDGGQRGEPDALGVPRQAAVAPAQAERARGARQPGAARRAARAPSPTQPRSASVCTT